MLDIHLKLPGPGRCWMVVLTSPDRLNPKITQELSVAGEHHFFASGAADADPAPADLSHDHDPARLYIEEAFVTIDRPGWDLILGKKSSGSAPGQDQSHGSD